MQRRTAARLARRAITTSRHPWSRRSAGARSIAGLLLAVFVGAASTGCASSTMDDPVPAEHVQPPVAGRALAASLSLSLERSAGSSAIYLESSGEDRIALFPSTHTCTVRGVKYTTQEPIGERGSDVWLSAFDAQVVRRMWQQGVHVGPSRSTASAFRGTSPSDVGAPLTMADLGPRPAARQAKRAPAAPARHVEGATPAERRAWSVRLTRPWEYIVVHHSATPAGNAAAFHKAHRARGWDGLGYHFVIGNGQKSPDGRIEVGFRWYKQREGAHAGNDLMNQRGIGICLVGDFNKSQPTAAQMRSLRRLCDFLGEYCNIAPQNLRLHRDFRKTACPGRNFPRSFALRPPAVIRATAAHGQQRASDTAPTSR